MMDEVVAVEGTMDVSGFRGVDELASYIHQVEMEFVGEADELLETFNLSHLKVHS